MDKCILFVRFLCHISLRPGSSRLCAVLSCVPGLLSCVKQTMRTLGHALIVNEYPCSRYANSRERERDHFTLLCERDRCATVFDGNDAITNAVHRSSSSMHSMHPIDAPNHTYHKRNHHQRPATAIRIGQCQIRAMMTRRDHFHFVLLFYLLE